MPFDDRLVNQQTPHRVYALCKLVRYKSLTREQLKAYVVPESLNTSDSAFANVFKFALNGHLISKDPDGKITLELSENEVESSVSFRKAIAKRTFTNPELIFCRFTGWYLMRGPKVFNESAKDLASNFDKEINLDSHINKYNDTNINGWRTWVSFLGLGFVHGGTLIPNAYVRLKDALEGDEHLVRSKPILFRDFISWLSKACPELDFGEISTNNKGKAQLRENELSIALSSGLRALQDQGNIRLNYIKDARETWYLERCDTHEIQDKVSQIVIERW